MFRVRLKSVQLEKERKKANETTAVYEINLEIKNKPLYTIIINQ